MTFLESIIVKLPDISEHAARRFRRHLLEDHCEKVKECGGAGGKPGPCPKVGGKAQTPTGRLRSPKAGRAVAAKARASNQKATSKAVKKGARDKASQGAPKEIGWMRVSNHGQIQHSARPGVASRKDEARATTGGALPISKKPTSKFTGIKGMGRR